MALADYYGRSAQAASQVMAGFDADAFGHQIGALEIGVAYGADVVDSSEGRALVDLLVRLLARFYPEIAFAAPDGDLRASLIELALAVNPRIEISTTRRPAMGIVVGEDAKSFRRSIYAGSDGWTAFAGTASAKPVGSSVDPFGAGAAACLASGLLFRLAVLGERPRRATERLEVAVLGPVRLPSPETFAATLVGCGAVGNSFAWAMSVAPDRGVLQLVDHEAIELSNLQRYVLGLRADEGAKKVDVLGRYFKTHLRAEPVRSDWQEFVAEHGYAHELVAVALDSAEDRRAVQASLPRAVLNAWTQPGNLGVSAHSEFGGSGACLACLYLPMERQPNEDEIYARALKVPERVDDIRTLLYSGAAVGDDFIALVAARLDRPLEVLAPFASRSIRDLYVRGVCGGEVLPLGSTGLVRTEVHVPLAHQSALAGVLLAARLVEVVRRARPSMTQVTQLDVLAPVPPLPTSPSAARSGCICRDADFRERYQSKWTSLSQADLPASEQGESQKYRTQIP